MIVLHAFGPAAGLPDASPFVIKTMIHLRMAGLKYDVKTGITSLKKSPKNKLPFIEDNGRTIADSTFIREYIEGAYGLDFDAGYDARERGVAYSVQKMLEESAYFAVVQRRWLRPDGWAVTQRELLAEIPKAVRWLIAPRIQKQVRQALLGQGTGRMTDAEVDAIAERGAKAVSDVLGDRPYLLGDRPSAVDATVLAYLLCAGAKAFPGPIRDGVVGRPNLLAYSNRLKKQYFPDFAFAE